MIGEIRDLETARIAIQAALTGHLVFSTLHTNSAIAAITRLIDIGLERYLLASTIAGVMAQRLVRKLCPACARPHTRRANARMASSRWRRRRSASSICRTAASRLAARLAAIPAISGRTTISELLVIDDGIREAIGRRSQDQRAIEQIARDDRLSHAL